MNLQDQATQAAWLTHLTVAGIRIEVRPDRFTITLPEGTSHTWMALGPNAQRVLAELEKHK